jgi:hypothetical protein
MKFMIGLMTVVVTWAVFIIFSIYHLTLEIDRNAIIWKHGLVTAASCEDTSTTSTITFMVRYDRMQYETREPIFLRPWEICDEALLKQFLNKAINISFYRDYYMDVVVGGVVLRTADEEIEALENPVGTWIFMLFLPFFTTLGFLGWFRHSKKLRSIQPNGCGYWRRVFRRNTRFLDW